MDEKINKRAVMIWNPVQNRNSDPVHAQLSTDRPNNYVSFDLLRRLGMEPEIDDSRLAPLSHIDGSTGFSMGTVRLYLALKPNGKSPLPFGEEPIEFLVLRRMNGDMVLGAEITKNRLYNDLRAASQLGRQKQLEPSPFSSTNPFGYSRAPIEEL